ncbi:GTP cyclohydrolase II [Nocardia sp. BMG51109]|uniref:GTP cyclohydrolase II n=1 Tax=Nocardia sp. BMG51109 TaxID=1056816 RepID=UPI000464B146|nr:GTP cyclohydrolase II [Nocardia sp. BMG51109]
MTTHLDQTDHDGGDADRRDDTRHHIRRKGRDLSVRVREFRDPRNGGTILLFGDVADGCLVRIHSRCLYGDALHSEDCDCGPELDLAMDLIQDAGAGVLVYLEQEGRGSGLLAKARGLHYSEAQGVDTFTSYRHLDLPADCRSYATAARQLHDLGLRFVRLLTNNPEKVKDLADTGIRVERVPLITEPRSERARAYMESKRHIRGHLLPEFGTHQSPSPVDAAPAHRTATEPADVPRTPAAPSPGAIPDPLCAAAAERL